MLQLIVDVWKQMIQKRHQNALVVSKWSQMASYLPSYILMFASQDAKLKPIPMAICEQAYKSLCKLPKNPWFTQSCPTSSLTSESAKTPIKFLFWRGCLLETLLILEGDVPAFLLVFYLLWGVLDILPNFWRLDVCPNLTSISSVKWIFCGAHERFLNLLLAPNRLRTFLMHSAVSQLKNMQ